MRPYFRVFLALGLGVLLLGVGGCSRQENAADATVAPDITPVGTNNAPESTAGFEEVLPRIGGVEGYAGSNSCRSCHESEFNSWHQSYHRTMTQLPSSNSVKADFKNVILTNENTRFVLTHTNEQHWVRMERVTPASSGDAGADGFETPIGLVTGSHHMQVFWVPSGQGNAQLGFPFTWLIPEQRWVPRKSTFIRPPDAAHLSEIWNITCCRCHTTGIEPHIDSVRRTAETRAAELGISCEACHGPGERHVHARSAQPDQHAVDQQILLSEIIQPRKLDPIRSAQVCGFCHSMKWIDAAENWRQKGFRYRPGDDLEQTTPIIRPGKTEGITGLSQYLEKNPDILHDFFWPDGMVRVSGRDYNGLLESPCYKGGQFSCLSCHSMHRSEPANQLARNRTGNSACIQCHENFGDTATLVAHTRHAAGSSGSECYNCHMPRTTYGVLKAIRSHQVSSPKVADQVATGRPNACNLCHLDKTLDWTAEHLTQWYGHAPVELGEDERAIADSVRLALTGDAGQRALVAWHFGWEPARQISGERWLVPVLAQLLDDPYAAVRCIAQRSIEPNQNLVPPDYDFAEPGENRTAVFDTVVSAWANRVSSEEKAQIPEATLVGAEEVPAIAENFRALLMKRNNRPVRLRE